MKNKWVARISALALTGILAIQPFNKGPETYVYADEVSNTYLGREEADAVIENITFSDVANSHWAKEAIVRLGALDIVKGYNENNVSAYRPNESVSNEEALAFILRLLGLEEAAQQEAELLEQQLETDDPALTIWSKGYLQLASDMGLITQVDLQDAFEEDQSLLEPEENFLRRGAVTREQVAEWLVQAVNQVSPELLAPVYGQNEIFNYSDWEQASPDKLPYIEAVLTKDIMVGDNNRFRPLSSLNRAEIAQIIKNVEAILYELKGIEAFSGQVENIVTDNVISNNEQAIRKYYIRNHLGELDVIQYEYNHLNGRITTKDVPVYKSGAVGGLSLLQIGDAITYLVDEETQEALYVQDEGEAMTETVRGNLQPLNMNVLGEITIMTPSGSSFTYTLSQRLYTEDTIKIGDHFVPMSSLSSGQSVALELQNQMVVGIDYYTEPSLIDEVSGIVKEVDVNYGYITIVEWNTGQDITKRFYKDSVMVEKQRYYDSMDEVGYIDQVFNTPVFDERDASIEAIVPGDIIHLKLDSSDSEYVSSISAKTNYVVKYGKITRLNYVNSNTYDFTLELENGQLAYYQVEEAILVRKNNQNIPSYQLATGDWVKLLVNQAVIDAGHIEEQVLEINIDAYNNVITKVFKAQLGTYNDSQETLSIRNAQELSGLGWLSYNNSSVGVDKEVEVYYKGQQISLSEALYRYSGDGYDAYIAIEEQRGTEQACKILIYDRTRDVVLDNDYVLSSDGGQSFRLFNTYSPIETHAGTIVIRNGRLVDASNILSPDYAQVVLNGASSAAVVTINKEPGNEALTISRGRIQEIEDNASFVVSSQGMLRDMNWVYSPIERTYTIDYETVIKDENGYVDLADFRDYEDWSQVDEVYTIISEGTKAKYLIKNPYVTQGLTGTVYEVDETISIKDVNVYDSDEKTWNELSLKSNYASLTLEENSIILKNNEVISIDELAIGDQLRVYTTEDLAEKLKLEGSRETIGYIILVE